MGAWPLSRQRLHDYAEKAAREAGVSTGWIDSDTVFEQRLHALVDAVFDDAELHAGITAMADRLRPFGWSNSLSAKLIQLTAPGVPDVYQGTELWDLSLVDPDNRRPVDYPSGSSCWSGSTAAGCPTSTRRAPSSCWWRRRRCGCAGIGRTCSPATTR